MEEWQVKQINKNLVKLSQGTKCNENLKAILLQNGLITEEEDQNNLREGSEFAKAKHLYGILITRLNGYGGLIEALKETNQTGPLAILQNGMEGRQLSRSTQGEGSSKPPVQQPSARMSNNHMETEDVPDASSNQATSVKDISIRAYIKSIKNRLFFTDDLPKDFQDPSVQRPQEKMQFIDDSYKLPTGFKGLFLLINIVKFEQNENRQGAAMDTRRLEVVFEGLGYEIIKVTGTDKTFTREMFVDILQKFKKRCASLEVKSSAVFLGSHGLDCKLQMSDGSFIDLETEVFSVLCTPPNNYHEVLGTDHWTNIPKMFFIQACRSSVKDDGVSITNCLISYACESGKPAWRDPENESVYVDILTDFLASFACEKDLVRILDMVRESVEVYSCRQRRRGKDIQKPEYIKKGEFGKLHFNLLPSYDSM